MAATNKARVRAIRQDELRQQLATQNHLSKVIDNIEKIESLKVATKGDSQDIDYKDLSAKQFELNKLEKANNQRLKLINKYLPDLKAVELSNSGSDDEKVFSISIVNPHATN